MRHSRKRIFKESVIRIDQDYLGGFLRRVFGSRRKAEVPITPEAKAAAEAKLMQQIRQSLPTDHELKRVEIIVLKYKEPAVEAECAKLLIEHTDWPYKLNFYDNRPGTKNMSKIWNQLIRESTCDYVVIMDSDVFVPKLKPCWLTRCMSTFERYPDCAVVSPMVTRTSGFQQQANKSSSRPPEKATEPFAGMCLLFKKEIFDAVGYFDEDFLLFGSDVEWAWRLLHSGERTCYLRPDVVVDHIWHASTRKASKEESATYNFSVEKQYSNKLYQKKTGQKR